MDIKHVTAGLLLALLAATSWATGGGIRQELPHVDAPAAWAPRFEVFHFGSIAEGTAFREVFLVHSVDPGFAVPASQLEVRRNGQPLAVTWESAGKTLGADDRFWFVDEAFDTKMVLTAHWAGLKVMECAYGGGAGIAIHPDEWRSMGMPEEVRCLKNLDDQLVVPAHDH